MEKKKCQEGKDFNQCERTEYPQRIGEWLYTCKKLGVFGHGFHVTISKLAQ